MTSARSLSDLSVKQRVELFEKECNAERLDGYAALFSPDVEASMGAMTATGRDAVVRTFATMKHAFPDLGVTFAHVVISGAEVAAELVERGTHSRDLVLPGHTIPATGRHMTLHTAAFFQYDDDGLIRSVRDYVDRAALREQLGM